MTHLDISDDLAAEIAAYRFDLQGEIPHHPDADRVLRDVIEGVFPGGIADAVATHPDADTERSTLASLIAILTIAIERGVTR